MSIAVAPTSELDAAIRAIKWARREWMEKSALVNWDEFDEFAAERVIKALDEYRAAEAPAHKEDL
jgi:hypothetical protein